MKKEALEKLTTKELEKKAKSHKTLIGIFIPLIIALFFFVIRDYFKNDEMEISSLTIAICTVGGLVSVIPELKKVQEVLKERNQ